MSNDVSSALNVLDGASFLQRIIELNLSDPRSPERIVYPLYVIATVVLSARMVSCVSYSPYVEINIRRKIYTYWQGNSVYYLL